jgi:hypothetical protein
MLAVLICRLMMELCKEYRTFDWEDYILLVFVPSVVAGLFWPVFIFLVIMKGLLTRIIDGRRLAKMEPENSHDGRRVDGK